MNIFSYPTLRGLVLLSLSSMIPVSNAQSVQLLLDQGELPEADSTLVANLYATKEASVPIASQIFFPGEWQVTEKKTHRLRMNFSELDIDESQASLWMEIQVDGKALHRRVWLDAAASPGVTFASGNHLNMDGNGISNLAEPVADEDAATKAYVDSQVAGVPAGDITAVTAGIGLSGGGTSGDVNLDVSMPLSLSGAAAGQGVVEGANTANTTFSVGVKGIGTWGGGYFKDSNASGIAYLGIGDGGIRAFGNDFGGYFKDSNESGYAFVGDGKYGIRAFGSTGGYFESNHGGAWTSVAESEYGISAQGKVGGYFANEDGSVYVFVARGNAGIFASADGAGGIFEFDDGANWAMVATSTYKIEGNGTVAFVQNHPENDAQVIVYTAPEGDEVATYTRGSAKLVNGEASIPLGETFKWVTNPDIGLTAHLTPVNGWAPLYVVSKTTSELVVRSAPGYPDDVAFDYLVYGLRIGFEDTTVVRKKTREAHTPSMADHRKAIAEQPELARYTALSRWAHMSGSDRNSIKANMQAATALLEKIGEFDPKIHIIGMPKAEK